MRVHTTKGPMQAPVESKEYAAARGLLTGYGIEDEKGRALLALRYVQGRLKANPTLEKEIAAQDQVVRQSYRAVEAALRWLHTTGRETVVISETEELHASISADGVFAIRKLRSYELQRLGA